MARGWESKSVEAQQQDAQNDSRKPTAPLSAAERSAMQRRRTLELARARTLADLERSSSPVHRAMLEQALRAIDEQMRQLG
jgi:hypothetical protein